MDRGGGGDVGRVCPDLRGSPVPTTSLLGAALVIVPDKGIRRILLMSWIRLGFWDVDADAHDVLGHGEETKIAVDQVPFGGRQIANCPGCPEHVAPDAEPERRVESYAREHHAAFWRCGDALHRRCVVQGEEDDRVVRAVVAFEEVNKSR